MKALITGITGQDGSYLAELLLKKRYEVHGIYRRTSTNPFSRIENIKDKMVLHCGDMTDGYSLNEIVKKTNPDEVYNLAAQSFVQTSFFQPYLTYEINFYGVDRLAQALFKNNPQAKFYQASTSEMFGQTKSIPQNESIPFNPVSPYGESKMYAHERVVKHWRKNGFFICSGILFNHESPRRGEEFVTKKIVNQAVKIKFGLQKKIFLGNLEAERDWGYAKEYVEAMWLMLQQNKSEDFVISTGETHSVKDFVIETFKYLGIYDWENFIEIDKDSIRPKEVNILKGDSTKAKQILKWEPKTKFKDLIKIMVDYELSKYNKN